MLTSPARSVRPAAPSRRLPPLATLAVILLIICGTLLGLLAVALQQYVLALLFWTVAAALTLGRQLAEQSRVANARFEEMTRELRLIRQGLAASALSAQPHEAQSPEFQSRVSPGSAHSGTPGAPQG